MRTAFALLAAGLVAASSVAQVCPCAAPGAGSPCALVTLVALGDAAETLGLSDEQRARLDGVREASLQAVHEIVGDLGALLDALHGLDRPYDPDEVFALAADLGHHQAELGETLRASEAALRAVLTAEQQVGWDAVLGHAAALQDAHPACADDGR